jgi:hypothetical protein
MLPRPLLVALAVPLVVIVGLQSAWAAFACRVDGRVRDYCCCEPEKPERDDRAAREDAPRIAARGCCDVTIHEVTEAPIVREADRATVSYIPAIGATQAVAVAAPRIERDAPIATMARPPPRIAIFLDKHAILR